MRSPIRMRLPRSKLEIEQLSDPDVRSVVVRHEHREFEQTLKEGHREIKSSDGPMDPRLHRKMPEIVATQLWDDSPPELWDTAARLRDAAYQRHEILHILARPVSEQIWGALHDERPYDHERRPRQRATTTPASRPVARRA